MMIRVSANTTLFWKFFLPLIYITFFGALALTIIFEVGNINLFTFNWFKISYLVVFFFFVLLLLFTVMRIKRVEVGQDHFIVTNYFKTYRYKLEDIDQYNKYNFVVFRIHSIKLKESGKFGNKIRFIPYLIGLDQASELSPKWKNITGFKN
jgi:hypothetical protein